MSCSLNETFNLSLAGEIVAVRPLFPLLREFCAPYLAPPGETPLFTVEVTPADLTAEGEHTARERARAGQPPQSFPDALLEVSAVHRKVSEGLLCRDILLFHGSAVAVGGEGYLFTAPSGTGKSTHTRLWRELLGERAVMVNDDKPLLKCTADRVLVCGSPWDGKHRLSSNTAVPLRGLCLLERGAENEIHPLPPREALPRLLAQSFRPADPQSAKKALELTISVCNAVPLYRLKCNMKHSAAALAYQTMKGNR